MNSRRTLAALFVCTSAALTSCASGGQTTAATPVAETTTPTPAPQRARVDQQSLTREALLQTERTTLYDAIQLLRSNWLRTRTADSFVAPSSVQVYLANQRVGGLEELRTISVRDVASVRYVDPVAAMSRWGTGHESGAIIVQLARQ
jgi:hypothetical protein